MEGGLAEPRPSCNSRLTKMETDGGSAAAFENEFTVYETCWMDGGGDCMCSLKEQIEGDKDNDPGSLPQFSPPQSRQEAWTTCQAPRRKTASGLLVTLTREEMPLPLLLPAARKMPVSARCVRRRGRRGSSPGDCPGK